jgi:hypothetical protein
MEVGPIAGPKAMEKRKKYLFLAINLTLVCLTRSVACVPTGLSRLTIISANISRVKFDL